MEWTRPRPYLDTNVLFSALHGSDSAPGAILDRHVDGTILMVVSGLVLEELVRTVRTVRSKRPVLLPQLYTFLTEAPPEVTEEASVDAVRDAAMRCIDTKDAPILAVAIACQADCVVSGNTRHFTQDVTRCAGISILTPTAYLAHLVERTPLGR